MPGKWVRGLSVRAVLRVAALGPGLGVLGMGTGCGGAPPPAAAAGTNEGAAAGSGSASVAASGSAAAPGSAAASGSAAAPGSAAATPASTPSPDPPSAAALTGGSVLVGDIPASKKFDPKTVIEAGKPAFLDCYNQARSKLPSLAGKLKLRVVVNQAGSAVATEAEPGGAANDPGLVGCLREAMKTLTFPKPGGMATVIVPLAFRP